MTRLHRSDAFLLIIVLSLAFGVLLIIPIGGADMPTVISILNSYAGLSACAAFLLAGCTTTAPGDYANETPKLDLSTYFNGKVDGWGMVQDRSGKVLRRMVVEMECRWNGNEGVLDESFRWSDGKTEKRVWKIRKDGDRYVGTAGDVIGEAEGQRARR